VDSKRTCLADHGEHDIVDAREGESHGGHGTDSDENCPAPGTWIRRVKERRTA
jgi:hypothetical protein